jgi:hypothetical protein
MATTPTGAGMDYSIYDCHHDTKLTKSYTVKYGSNREKYRFQEAINDSFARFLSDFAGRF